MKLKIVSDINGVNEALQNFACGLAEKGFDVEILNSLSIGKITAEKKEDRHKQFLDFGVENAVDYLTIQEDTNTHYIGFSIGGNIIWEAISRGMKAESLYCVSSTRLRYQESPLNVSTRLLYGNLDKYRPDDEKLDLISKGNFELFDNIGHEFYNKAEYVTVMELDYCYWISNDDKVDASGLVCANIVRDFILYMELVNKVQFKLKDRSLICTGNIQTIGKNEEDFVASNQDTIIHYLEKA